MMSRKDLGSKWKGLLCLCVLAHVANPAILPAAQAQEPDAAGLHQAALRALGGEDIHGIEFSGAGWDACLGQAWSLAEGWARWELTDYHRVIDYGSPASSHSTLRRAGMDPGRIGGCGAQPDAGPAPQRGFIDGSSPWPDQLLIWLSPHGFLRLLESGEGKVERAGDGWQVSVPHVHDSIRYTFVGRFNQDYELESLRTWVDDAIFGDMEVLAEFGEYQAFEGLSFPQSLTINQGGFPTLSLSIDNAAASHETAVDTSARRPPPPRSAEDGPAYEEIGEGIYAIHGGYQAVAVEFADFSLVIDGLQSDSRVQELIQTVKQAIPDKPIRYVVSTHSHFDHAYGLRQFAAEGAVILTHAMNVAFFEQALSTPRTLRVDATEPDEVAVKVQGIDGRYTISDGSRQAVELYALGPSPHAADMLVAYLPRIKAVVEADILQPWINPIFGGENGPHPMLVYLADELEGAGIDYQRFVPIHVPPDPPMMERAALEAVLAE